jgi:Flp pilus assembly protein TadG
MNEEGKITVNRNHEHGQSFIELSVSMVFLLILLSVVMDLGYALYSMTALRDTAQEAASYGAICPIKEDGTTRNDDLIKARAQYSTHAPLNIEDINPSDITVEFLNTSNQVTTTPVMGGSVQVSLTIFHEIKAPFVANFIGTTTYPLRVTVADTIIRNMWLVQCDF